MRRRLKNEQKSFYVHDIQRQRQNSLYIHGGIAFTPHPHRLPDHAVHRTLPPVPRASAGQPPETAIDPPRSPHTDRQPPRSSSLPAAIATPGHHRDRTPDPRPNTGWTPGARTHVRTAGGTDGSPGTFAAQPGYHVHLTTDSKRQVWQRDGRRCSYLDRQTGRRCNSRHMIEMDHILPYALGGGADPENRSSVELITVIGTRRTAERGLRRIGSGGRRGRTSLGLSTRNPVDPKESGALGTMDNSGHRQSGY